MPSIDRLKIAICWLLLVLWLAATAALAWVMVVYPSRRQAVPSRDTPVALPEGASIDVIAEKVAASGAVPYPELFAFYLRVLGADRTARTRWVVVNPALSPQEHLPRLARGFGTAVVQVVIPEGFTSFDVATRFERYAVASREALLRAMRDPTLLRAHDIAADSAEGYLFPALYRFQLDTAPERVVTKMITTFHARVAALFDPYARAESASPVSLLTPHQLVTLASIVEREARVPEERPRIAGVFVNRLFDPSFRPKRLQADPTVAYGCLVAGERIPSCRTFDGRRITPAMVRDPENPYSTYRHEGLPPGPICNPGMASLQAAVMPEQHDFFYFVAKGGGRHAFAHSLDQHNQNIRVQ